MLSFFTLLGIACYFDYKYKKIPNLLLFLLFLLGIIRNMFYGGVWESVIFLGKVFTVLFLLYPLFQIAVIGAGDVKLYSVCAGCLPFSKIFYFFFFSFFIASIFSLIFLIQKKKVKERFLYFCQYCRKIMRTGTCQLYIEDEIERKSVSVCLAGPILCSILLCWGGVF